MTHAPKTWLSKATASLGPQYVIYSEESGSDIAIVYNNDENTKANAELLAAAPELLEALENLLAWANIHDDGTYRQSTQALCVARNARAAIAKAKGGTP